MIATGLGANDQKDFVMKSIYRAVLAIPCWLSLAFADAAFSQPPVPNAEQSKTQQEVAHRRAGEEAVKDRYEAAAAQHKAGEEKVRNRYAAAAAHHKAGEQKVRERYAVVAARHKSAEAQVRAAETKPN